MMTANALTLAIFDESSRWSEKDIVLLLLGAVISLYTTIVFERYKRFAEMLRAVARNRELSVEYPPYSTDTVNLEAAYRQMESFWEFLAESTWNLEAEGHREAAIHVARLQSYMKNASRCVGRMLGGSIGTMTAKQFLHKFTTEYRKIFDENFQCFEERLRPSWKALLQFYPHPTLPESRVTTDFDYFHELLNLPPEPPKMHL